MSWSTKLRRRVGIGMLCASCAGTVFAADETHARGDELLDLSLDDLLKIPVSTGVRFEGQTQADSALSVVSFSAEDLRTDHGGANDLNMVLRDLLPSFNYLTEPLNDGSSHVRAFSLRGLPGDETLVLVNGKRFHRSALVQVGGSSPITLGSQGTDLSQIPAFGLQRVEVLRDGASAQYGSDAIAGVINLILSDRAEGVETQVQRGGTSAGDGGSTRVSVNAGTKLGDKGFFNITGEFVKQDEISRGGQRADAAYYASQGLSVANPAQIWGSPILDSDRLLWNARVDLPYGAQAYMFGNFSDARSDASFNYRALTRNFFINNLDTVNGSLIPCPAVAGDQYGYLTASNCLAQAKATPGLFNFQSVFPGGFTPRLYARNTDFSEVMGVNGDMQEGRTYDFSISYARDNLDYVLNHTINPSLGPASPTSLALGTLSQTEINLNADFVWPVSTQLSLAAGAEWRQEIYEPRAGEPASWEAGPYTTLGIGANGLAGIAPAAAGRFARQNISAYVDSEYHASDALLLSGAVRSEKYSDFGETTNGKLSFRYLLNDKLTLRGALGTGFRAPSPGQANLTNIGFNGGGGGATIQVVGTIPPTNPISQFFGARPLQPETSRNASLGMAYRQKYLSLTVDAFRISVKDRIELSNGFVLTDAIRSQMLAAGIANSNQYDTISVFNNAADSVSTGLDVTAGYELQSRAGITEFKMDFSYVDMQAHPNGHGLVVSPQALYSLANQMPKARADLSVRHRLGDWKFNAATVFYGPSSVSDASESFSSKSITNVEVSFAPDNGKTWVLAAGVGDLFNTQAYRTDASGIGGFYITENPFEYTGRTYYANAKYTF